MAQTSPSPVLTNARWHLLTEGETAIVFVHGIFSDSGGCWRFEDPDDRTHTAYWPDLVASDSRLATPATASIFLGGYTTAINAGDLKIADAARALVDAMQLKSATLEPPPLDKPHLVFVCHSTGGIVARYMLTRYRELFEPKVLGLVLLASPSLGSIYANKLRPLAKFYNQQLGLQLQWGGESLTDLDGQFKDLVNQRRLNLIGTEAYEHYFILRRRLPSFLDRLIPNRRKIVDKLSAGRYFGDARLIENTDHFSIVKPNGVQHPSHEFLVSFLTNEFEKFKKICAMPAPPRPRRAAGGPPDSGVRPVRTELYEAVRRYESVSRLAQASDVTLDRVFQPDLLHRTVTIRRPDAELELREELVNISAEPQFALARIVVSDTPTDFKDMKARAQLRPRSETS